MKIVGIIIFTLSLSIVFTSTFKVGYKYGMESTKDSIRIDAIRKER